MTFNNSDVGLSYVLWSIYWNGPLSLDSEKQDQYWSQCVNMNWHGSQQSIVGSTLFWETIIYCTLIERGKCLLAPSPTSLRFLVSDLCISIFSLFFLFCFCFWAMKRRPIAAKIAGSIGLFHIEVYTFARFVLQKMYLVLSWWWYQTSLEMFPSRVLSFRIIIIIFNFLIIFITE